MEFIKTLKQISQEAAKRVQLFVIETSPAKRTLPATKESPLRRRKTGSGNVSPYRLSTPKASSNRASISLAENLIKCSQPSASISISSSTSQATERSEEGVGENPGEKPRRRLRVGECLCCRWRRRNSAVSVPEEPKRKSKRTRTKTEKKRARRAMSASVRLSRRQECRKTHAKQNSFQTEEPQCSEAGEQEGQSLDPRVSLKMGTLLRGRLSKIEEESKSVVDSPERNSPPKTAAARTNNTIVSVGVEKMDAQIATDSPPQVKTRGFMEVFPEFEQIYSLYAKNLEQRAKIRETARPRQQIQKETCGFVIKKLPILRKPTI